MGFRITTSVGLMLLDLFIFFAVSLAEAHRYVP